MTAVIDAMRNHRCNTVVSTRPVTDNSPSRPVRLAATVAECPSLVRNTTR